MGHRAVLLAVLAAALAFPATSLAASGSLVDGVMNYTAGGGESNSVVFTLVQDEFGEPTYQVVDAPAVNITPQSPCFNGGQQNIMECPADGNGAGAITILTASLGDGNDTIQLLADLPTSIGAGGGQDVMTGGPAADFLRGGQGGDTISGGNGADQIIGDDPNVAGGGDDRLDGGPGADTIDGQDGNDVVISSGEDGGDECSGGGGIDVMSYAGATKPVTVSLDDQANDGVAGEGDNVETDIENVVGGSAGDAITGSEGGNGLDGGPGDDIVRGGGGDDSVIGNAGADSLFGDAGNDELMGDDGNDAIQGGDGGDSLEGGVGDDALDGSGGPDVMLGGDGVDLGNYGDRSVPLTITIDGNADDGAAGEGDNVQTDVENLRGGSAADTFKGSPGANTLDGGDGEDYADGGAGPDVLIGGGGGDVLRSRGSTDAATITCGDGPDFVIAKPTDTIAPDCDRADRGVNQKPKRRDRAVVTPTSGALQMSPAGIVRRVPLQDKVVLPLRSIVDTVAGAVKVTAAPTARKRETIALDHGVFNIAQSAARTAITQFALLGGDFTVCPARQQGARRASSAGARPAASKTVRQLWAKGKGKFRTKGRYAVATIRGTRWRTIDRCDGTLIRVQQGVVAVRDMVKKKTVLVKAGKRYLARATRR